MTRPLIATIIAALVVAAVAVIVTAVDRSLRADGKQIRGVR